MDGETSLRMNDNGGGQFLHTGMVGSSSPSRSVPIASPPSGAVGVGFNGTLNYLLHPVSKFDTLAGVAIKYGVEVADIKRLNGLVTDFQMFALRTLQIPLPGRHPPSPGLSNGQETPPRASSYQQNASSRRHSDLFDSFPSLKLKSSSEQKVSPAMSSLQGYYGLRPADQKGAGEGFEMAVYRKGGARYLEDAFAKSSPISNPPLSHQRKSKSTANCLMSENGELIDQVLSQEAESSESDKWIEKLVRQRQKSEVDFTVRTPEKLLKENTSSNSISVITGKGLALRPKSASRAVTGVDSEAGSVNPIPTSLGDAFSSNGVNGVRKSSSASSLQDSDSGTLSSIWPTSKWSLKPDFQALSTAAITRPIFDGLPKPSNRRNKAALD
ncbi:hypothetical protein CDL12_26311 [Handroanthus impetiginosus]|uniref:LysM domain-containing protein n=1 Tax=Handroanthus impetiginosus TaxID=429701 RepID=A0A2G9G799_9LAMI|nr:hypothetical protein CDL12_26311 [Handroanthus impetiginosus]